MYLYFNILTSRTAHDFYSENGYNILYIYKKADYAHFYVSYIYSRL